MKKIFAILTISALVAGCSSNSGEGGAALHRAMLDFEGDAWSALVDSPQYGGNLLYQTEGYSWYDAETDLAHRVNSGMGGEYYFCGGMALSNYYSKDYASASSFMEQLTVYAESAHSGSNCIVANGYHSSFSDMGYGDCPSLYFKNEAAYIESLWVANTCYSYASAIGGLNAMAPALSAMQSIWVRATGYTLDTAGVEIEGTSLDFYLYEGGKVAFDGWKKWDLTPLGVVNRVKFDVQWNGEGGADMFLHPAYFAIDDITVARYK